MSGAHSAPPWTEDDCCLGFGQYPFLMCYDLWCAITRLSGLSKAIAEPNTDGNHWQANWLLCWDQCSNKDKPTVYNSDIDCYCYFTLFTTHIMFTDRNVYWMLKKKLKSYSNRRFKIVFFSGVLVLHILAKWIVRLRTNNRMDGFYSWILYI